MNHSWEEMRVRRFVRLGEEMSEVPLDPKNAIDHRYWKRHQYLLFVRVIALEPCKE